MVKKVYGIYIDKEIKENAQKKAAKEFTIFKFSSLVEKLLADYLKVDTQEDQE